MSSVVSSMASTSVFIWDVVNVALDNELILSMIFYNLSDPYLKVCRLVCSKWNRLSVKQMEKNIWSNRKILKLESDEKLQDFINTFASSPNSLIFSCFSFHGKLNHILLKNFFKTFPQKMKSLFLDYILKDLKQLEDILNTQATSLLEFTIRSHVEDFEKFTREKKKSESKSILCLPNLRFLCLKEYFSGYDNIDEDQVEIEEQKQSQVYIQLMTWLLSIIPIENNSQNSVPLKICLKDCKTLTGAVNSMEMCGHIKHLKMIEVGQYKPGELNILNNAGVELELISVSRGRLLGERQIFTGEIYQFLQRQINSLEVLELEARVFKFPSVMTALKILYLTVGIDLDGGTAQIPLLYHQYFPNLQVLLLRSTTGPRQHSSYFISQFLSPQNPCLSLRKLTIYYSFLEDKVMKRISLIFAQIKSLKIGYYLQRSDVKESLLYSEIWNSSFAETLEELCLEIAPKIHGEETFSDGDIAGQQPGLLKLNTVFSGVRQEKVHSLYKFLVFEKQEFDESKYDSILKLKNLKKLQILCYFSQKYPFTDFSAFYIFGNMKKLEVLHLDEKLRKFTPNALEYLRNKKRLYPTSSEDSLVVSHSTSEIDNYEMYFLQDVHSFPFTKNIFNLLDDKKWNTIDHYKNSKNVVDDVDSNSDSDPVVSDSDNDNCKKSISKHTNFKMDNNANKNNAIKSASSEDDENSNLEGHCIGEHTSDENVSNHSEDKSDVESEFGMPELVEFGENDNNEFSENELNDDNEEEEKEEWRDRDERIDKDESNDNDSVDSRENNNEDDEFSDSY